DHLDRGTEILLRTVDALRVSAELRWQQHESNGATLDLGSGWGPIALETALLESERIVWAVEVNARSRALTEMNAERLGLTNRVRVRAPEDVEDALQFDLILSNPPIRVGKQALHNMLDLWLPRLSTHGEAFLVVAKHLGAASLQAWITEQH